MDELPLAILSNILSRVSSESLLRYRCVCKRWGEVVDDSYFRNSLHRLKGPVVLCHAAEEEKIYLLKVHEEAATQMIEIGKFPALKGYACMGACNGLLFYMHWIDVENNPELLINPLTKEILRLPRAPDLQPNKSVFGFGFDRSTNTYKMVQIEKARNFTMTRIYDFKKRSWRTCKAPPSSHSAYSNSNFIFASGALNWKLINYSLAESLLARVMLSFDLTKEEFSLIPIPDVFFECGDFNLWTRMHELGGSLALVHCPNKTYKDVWVLRDYPRREWTRKYRIQPPWGDVIGPYQHDKLIFYGWRGTYLYDVNKDRYKTIRTEARLCDARFRCETLSLVSLQRHGDDPIL